MRGRRRGPKKGKHVVKEEDQALVKTCNLPPEVIEDILSWLPAKPLIQFRCVSKQWCAFLTDPIFIEKHLSRRIKNGEDNSSLILQVTYKNEFYYIPNEDFKKAVKLDNPITEDDSKLSMVGCLNGLVCFYFETKSEYSSVVYLWNPATSECKRLPCPLIPQPRIGIRTVVVYGFISYPTVDDYNVVRLVNCETDEGDEYEFTVEVEIYSLTTNAWKRIGVFPSFLLDKQPGLSINGAIHWAGSHANLLYHDFILAFDMDEEEFLDISLPHLDRFDISNIFLRTYRGCLSMFIAYNFQDMDLWVLNKYDTEESWTKLFTFPHQRESPYPLEFLKNGELLLKKYPSRLAHTYNLEGKKYRKVHVRGVDKAFAVKAIVYTESLVPLMATRNESQGQVL